MEPVCKHISSKEVKCCGSQETKEIPWCEKLDKPLQGGMCAGCEHDEKTESGSKLQKLRNITRGYVHLGIETVLPDSPKDKRAFVKRRLEACQICEHRTFLTFADYNAWIRDTGGMAKFIQEINQLDRWPLLPDNKDPDHGKLFCRRCKCLLAAKANEKTEMCPAGNPAWDIEKESGNG